MAGSLMDFNECVSKGELTTFMTEQRNLMTELTRNVNNLVTRIEQLEQRPPPHCADDEDADDFGDEDADADGYARCRLNFNRRGMGGNIQGNTSLSGLTMGGIFSTVQSQRCPRFLLHHSHLHLYFLPG
jgi:hypothetical protein